MKDFVNIKIAIELDRGKSVLEVAKEFKVKTNYVKAIAKKTIFFEKKITRKQKRKHTHSERSVLVERIGKGELLEEISVEEGVSQNTLRRWCKLYKVVIPRRIEKISDEERNEIRELLENNDWKEISKIYNISKDVVEELKDPPHCQLDSETLSYLFELLREKPQISVNSICKIMKEEGFVVFSDAVRSYKKRLRSLKII